MTTVPIAPDKQGGEEGYVGDLSKTHVFQKVREKLNEYSGPITLMG